jgi:hypothetical protein
LNEAIAADMYQDVDEKMKPLVHACCETLLRYRDLSVSMDLPPKLRQTVKSQNSANGEFDSWEYLEESSRRK